MKYGISGAALPGAFPFVDALVAVAVARDFWPCVLGAIKANESGSSTDPRIMQEGTWPGSDFLALPDGSGPDPNNPAGHGIFQLTASWPPDWFDPTAAATYALTQFLEPAVTFWVEKGFTGDALVKCIAASYNAGTEQAWDWHVEFGDVDHRTTDRYGDRAVAAYHLLVSGRLPWAP